MFESIEFFKGNSRGAECGLLRRYTSCNDICSVGRSMIEMLGVLAIIAVLTVGGIAGYSKAMEKYKLNKVIGEYSYLIQGLLQHADDLKKLPNNYSLNNLIQALNIVPEAWKVAGLYTDS